MWCYLMLIYYLYLYLPIYRSIDRSIYRSFDLCIDIPISIYIYLYLCIYLFIYLSICLSIYLYLSIYIYLSLSLSIYLSISTVSIPFLSINQSNKQSIRQSFNQSINQSTNHASKQFINRSIHPSIYLPIFLFVCGPVRPSVRLFVTQKISIHLACFQPMRNGFDHRWVVCHPGFKSPLFCGYDLWSHLEAFAAATRECKKGRFYVQIEVWHPSNSWDTSRAPLLHHRSAARSPLNL